MTAISGASSPGISGETRVAAVIGWPARHSLSPVILNAAFAQARLDWRYVVFEVAPGRGGAAVEAMRTLGLGGLSVTMPHKADVSRAVDRRTPVAEALDAVNCVYWEGHALAGDNTDGAGFVDSLRVDAGYEMAGRRCLVVGAGGAARAVIRALAEAGAGEVVVLNRSADRAAQAVVLAGPVGRVGGPDDVERAELVVNATPLGMAAGPAAERVALPVDPARLHAGQVVADLVYHPLTTPLLAAADARGAATVTGLGMLVHQAAHAFRRWTDREPPLAAMASAARDELGRRAASGRYATSAGAPAQSDGKDS